MLTEYTPTSGKNETGQVIMQHPHPVTLNYLRTSGSQEDKLAHGLLRFLRGEEHTRGRIRGNGYVTENNT